MLADLHTHSTASDGGLAPDELLQLAIDRGIEMLAITDHDTVCGTAAVTDLAPDTIRLIPGVELSANWKNNCIHVVGLQIDVNNPTLQQGLRQQQQTRTERATIIATKLERAGFRDALAGAQQLASDEYIGRPQFARFLVESGQVRDIKTAFKKYLGRGKVGDVRHCWPTLDVVTSWVAAAGGTAVLAHPAKYKLSNLRLEELCKDFAHAGGTGLEVVSGAQDASVTEKLARLAVRHSLLASCGSDFHRPGQAWAKLGAVSPLPSICRPVWDAW